MAQDLVIETLHDWTSGLSETEARVSVFEHVRDIPYTLIQELIDPQKGPVGILKRNGGSCSPKHYLLGRMFEQLGIPTKYATYPFRWGDAEVDYPGRVRSLAEQMPLGYHLACKAYLGERWILVDATWDPPLARIGCPINERWDGFAETQIALVSVDEIVHETAEERGEYVRAQTAWHTQKEESLIDAFHGEFNRWLVEVRAS